MAEKFVSERNLKFLLYEVFDTISLLQLKGLHDVISKLRESLFKPV